MDNGFKRITLRKIVRRNTSLLLTFANHQKLSGFRLQKSCKEAFLLEMLDEGCRRLCDWNAPYLHRGNILAGDAYEGVAKRHHRAPDGSRGVI
jgi:hypothetical protein